MNFFRQLLILAMMSLTAWSGMPHIGCRCSTGEFRLYCPRVTQQMSAAACDGDASGCKSGKSCCGGEKVCAAARGVKSNSSGEKCCVEGCRCTPVYFQGKTCPTLKKVVVSDIATLEFVAPVILSAVALPPVARVDISVLDYVQRVPDDLVILCERWLI